jgi:HEPN domain-containing protein
MELKEHIDYWIRTSNDDFEVFQVLLSSGKYLHAFFIAHLTLEKLIKAHWVRDNNNTIPPKQHNLVNLAKQTKLILTQEQLSFLVIMNDFQIQGRYPDFKFKVNQLLTREFVDQLVPQFNSIRQCLLETIT